MIVRDNTFQYSNSSAGNGAAIFWKVVSDTGATLQQNTFDQCFRYADFPYKDDRQVGTIPTTLSVEIHAPAYINQENRNGMIFLTNFSSYDLQKVNISSMLIDGFNQVVYDPSATEENPIILEINLLGTSVDSRQCDYHECHLIGPNIPIIAKADESISAQLVYKSSAFTVTSNTINIVLRNCRDGEINTILADPKNPPQCNPCPADSYSLNSLVDKECHSCPQHVTCPGKNVLILDPGYWRENSTSAIIMKCRDTEVCLGGSDPHHQCAKGLMGPLCNSCDKENKYVKGSTSCLECPNAKTSLIVAVLVVVGTLVYQIWYIKAVRTSNSFFIAYFGEKQDYEHGKRVELYINQGMYIRLLVTYYQIASIIATFQLDFSQIYNPNSTPSTLDTNPLSILLHANKCALLYLGVSTDRLIYYQIAITVLSPISKLVILGVFRMFIWKFRINEKRFSILMVTIICLFMLEQPAICEELFSFLSCIPLGTDGPYYLQKDHGVMCYTSDYNFFRNVFVYPAIALYVVIVPAIYLRILIKNKTNMNSVRMRMNLGALYNEYHPRAFFWGIFLVMVKVVLMYLGSTLYSDVKTKALSVFIVLYLYYALYLKYHPYDKQDMFKAEQIALITYLFTIFGSIYYIDNTIGIVQWITLVIIALLNVYTLFLLIYRVIKINLVSLKIFTLPDILRDLKQHEKPKDLDINFLDEGFTYKPRAIQEETLEQVENKIFGKDEDDGVTFDDPKPKCETELPTL